MSNTFAPLRENRDFRRFYLSAVISAAGTAATLVVLPLYVYKNTGSALAVAMVSVAQVLPNVLLGLFAGAHVDRAGSRRKVLIVASVVSCLSMTIATAIIVSEPGTVIPILAFFFIVQSVEVYVGSVTFAAIPALVDKDSVVQAQTLVSGTSSTISLIIPWVGAGLYGLVGAAPIFAADAVSFALASVFALRLRNTLPCSPRPVDESVMQSIRAGVKYLWRHSLVRTLTVVGVFNAFTGGILATLYVVYADDRYGIEPTDSRIAVFAAAGAVGAFIGNWILPVLRRRWEALAVCSGALLTVFAAIVGVAVSPNAYLAALCYGLWQTAYLVVIMNAITLRMVVVEPEFLGRVGSTARMISWGAAPVAAVIGAAVSEAIGVRYVIGGASLFALLGWLLLQFFRTGLSRRAQPDPQMSSAS